MTLRDLGGWGVAALVLALAVPLVIWLAREYMKLKDKLLELVGTIMKAHQQMIMTLASLEEAIKAEGDKTKEIRDDGRSVKSMVDEIKETLKNVNDGVVALVAKHK